MSDFNRVLLLDIGNTFIHWRYDQQQGSQSLADLRNWVPPVSVSEIDIICYCAVSDPRRWHEWLISLPVNRCYRCERPFLELLNTVYEPQQLGIDRWLALLGASVVHDIKPSALVVDVGTAVTLDMVEDNRHQGGWIGPGLFTWCDSITQNTHISVPLNTQPTLSLAHNTIHAISNGWLVAVRSMIQQSLHEYGMPKLVITGGHGEALRPIFPSALYFDNLVLDGLSHWTKVCMNRGSIS